MKSLEPVIGLEIHLQLKTKSKMFCSCANEETAAPNQNTCPICLGHPGTLPVPNEQAIRWAILVGLALNCHINSSTKFDRKHYFYPDLPKGYQISQFDKPIAEKGSFSLSLPSSTSLPSPLEENGWNEGVIGITRVHLEEDSAKSFHGTEGKTYVDFNRAGTPLVEIVTEPDFRAAREAKFFLQELQLVARALGVSFANMEKGELRCDVNISLREIDKNGIVIGSLFNPKTEIKNLNSFKAVERAIEYEIQRQSKLWQTASPPAVQSTRGWNDNKQITEEQRVKEAAEDYRYFPEPDIPAMEIGPLAEELRYKIPELPAARRARFIEEYAMNHEEARQIVENQALADFAEQAFSELLAWLSSLPEWDNTDEKTLEKEKRRLSHLAYGWLISKLGGVLTEKNLDFNKQKMAAENFAEFIIMIAQGRLSTQNGLAVLAEMVETGADPEHVLENKALNLITDEDELAGAVDKILLAWPNEVARYKKGEKQLLKFFIGQLMKETGGKAEPVNSKILLEERLK